MSINRRMCEQIVIYLYSRVLYSHEKEQTTDTPTVMDEAQKHCVNERDSQTQKKTYCPKVQEQAELRYADRIEDSSRPNEEEWGGGNRMERGSGTS